MPFERPSARGLVSIARSLVGQDFFPAVTPTRRAVRYRNTARPGVAPLGDIYIPRDANGASVVLLHGGGFVVGARDMLPMRYLAASLTRVGIAVFSIDYRLVFRGGRLAEAEEDGVAALRFWREECLRFGLDPSRISLVGLSAGATLAMLAASEEPALHRLVGVFGLYDIESFEGPLARVMPRLLSRSWDKARWRELSPLSRRQSEAPTLLLHGTGDQLIDVSQAHRLLAHRESLGLPTRLVTYEGAPHAFFSMDGHPARDGVAQIVSHLE
jgi:acetyl esterase/lipase